MSPGFDALRDGADEALERLALAQHPGDDVALDDARQPAAHQLKLTIDRFLFQRLDDHDRAPLGDNRIATSTCFPSPTRAVTEAILSSLTSISLPPFLRHIPIIWMSAPWHFACQKTSPGRMRDAS